MEKLKALWGTIVTKVSENKETVIRVGGVVAGAVIGVVAASVVANIQERNFLNAMLVDEEELDTTEETTEE